MIDKKSIKGFRYYFTSVSLIALFSLILALPTNAQLWQDGNFGGSVGVAFNLGSTVNRLGIQVNGFYVKNHFQLNTGLRFYYNFNSLGPKVPRPESQFNVGLLYALGKQDTIANDFLHAVSNQTGYKYSIAYARNFYFEKLTRQETGAIGLSFGKVELIHENDAFSFYGKDRYRTGGLLLSYRFPETRLALNTTLWHGNTHGSKVKRIREAGSYNCRHGYKDLSDAHCGRSSHGLLFLQAQQVLPYAQTAQASVGIDSERIRHFWQNRVIHDLVLFPSKWENAHNPHYPMLDKDGNPYLFKEGQELRPTRLYLDLGLNPTLFY